MKKNLLLLLFAFSLINCGPKKYSDYDPREFYESQGVVTHTNISSKNLGTRKTYIQYSYNFENDSIFTGYQGNLDYYIVKGQPIVVLVNKQKPEINFFARIGIIDENVWSKGLQIMKKNEKNK